MTPYEKALIQKAAELFNVDPERMQTRSRAGRLPLARQMVMVVLMQNGYTCTDAARVFKLHHTAALHGAKTVRDMVEVYQNYKDAFEVLQCNHIDKTETQLKRDYKAQTGLVWNREIYKYISWLESKLAK
jgi:hypothetical protein